MKQHFLKYKSFYVLGVISIILFGTLSFIFADTLSQKIKNVLGNDNEYKTTLDIVGGVEEKNLQKQHCEIILRDSIVNYSSKSGEMRQKISSYFKTCENIYDIKAQKQDISFCKRIIGGSKKDFQSSFILLDGFEEIQNKCIEQYLTVSFTGGTLFNENNDFKSDIILNFGLPFYYNAGEPNSDDFINHRIEAKQRLISLLDISPKVEIDTENIVLYGKQAIVSLDLKPETEYTFTFANYDSEIEGQKVSSKPLTITTPNFQYFGLQRLDGVTLIPNNITSEFLLQSYNSDIGGTKIKICRIPAESYAKIEVLEATRGMSEDVKNFFKQRIDSLGNEKCYEKEIKFTETSNTGSLVRQQNFNLGEQIGNPATPGLYYITFSDLSQRELYKRVQKALFFGVVNSHITMKLSKNGSVFFFVNDFNGKPLVSQKIEVFSNEFAEKNTEYNYEKREDEVEYFSPLGKSIFGTGIVLGETNQDGILQVNLEGKIKDYFDKTLDSWSYGIDGNFNSFFVSATGGAKLGYVSSKWNGGITPWNFGYSIDSWSYGPTQTNIENISLGYDSTPDTYLAHIFAERRLYLPGETVHIKAVVRNSGNLSLPVGDEFRLSVVDPQGEKILDTDLTVSEYGAIDQEMVLPSGVALGNYNIYLNAGDRQIAESGFQVEIFQNPKFKNDVSLEVRGLDDSVVEITDTQKELTQWGYERPTYSGNFSITATIDSQYYSGNAVSDGKLEYKVYKQAYYDSSYWEECFYGCYWEAEKEFYTQGTGSLDAAGKLQIDIPVNFESNYDDYKYIVEATVTDTSGDIISGTNSIIARLPSIFKTWNPENRVQFEVENRFYESGEKILIKGGLSFGKFSEVYENQDIFIIKKKEYYTDYVQDVRGYERPITRSEEKVLEVLLVNSENFDISKDGKLSRAYTMPETGEYIFQYGKIHAGILGLSNGVNGIDNIKNIVQKFQESGNNEVFLPQQTFSNYTSYEVTNFLTETCDDTDSMCDFSNINTTLWCQENIDYSYSAAEQQINLCENKKETLTFSLKIQADDLIESYDTRYFSLISYGESEANNPIISDNKITVLSEKMVYNIGDTARVLVRLPFSNGKILWTEEKDEVITSELIDVTGNIFFKEIPVTDVSLPNTYISVMAIDIDFTCDSDTSKTCIPEYRVGYTEIVGDKTDKKSDVTITADKKVYETREVVTLNFQTEKKEISELTVMVIDDSLISLMGNIDVNILEKIYKKLPFQIQTSISNIAMLANYYFSRQGIVGGSGMGDFKGGDSSVSSRNIFKNTAYYNPSVITDANGKAKIEFTLPDNLTNFRVMALAQSKNNFFGYGETMIEVRKDVILEARVPQIIRERDNVTLGANVFNTTQNELSFEAKLISTELTIEKSSQNITVPAGKSAFVEWETVMNTVCNNLNIVESCDGNFTMSITSKNPQYSDQVEGSFEIATDPLIFQNVQNSALITPNQSSNLGLKITQNTDTNKSKFTLSLSNNPLAGIENTFESLVTYPYGSIEHLLSSTLPNAVLERFKNIDFAQKIDQGYLDTNLKNGYEAIQKLQRADGGFKYWENDFTSDREITPYVLRNLVELKKSGYPVDETILSHTAKYLIDSITPETPQHIKLEALWALSASNPERAKEIFTVFAGSNIGQLDTSSMSQHELLSYTYALYYLDPTTHTQKINTAIDILLSNKRPVRNELYYSTLEDQAILASLMMDVGKSQSEVSGIILQLFEKNWKSYWISSKQKNAAFLAFVKYMETYGTRYVNTLSLDIGNTNESVSLDSDAGEYKIEKKILEILSGSDINVNILNKTGGASVFAQSDIEIHPKNPLDVKPYTQGITAERIIYEVTDASQIKEECTWQNNMYNCIQGKGLKLHTSDTFDAGKTYKIVLRTNFAEDNRRNNLTLEDYLPAGFSVLNAKFLTNSIATNQESSGNTWSWNQTQNRPDRVMANAKYSWGTKSEYSYFVRADYAGTFLYPPFAAYLMQEPTVRGNTGFRKIIIKK